MVSISKDELRGKFSRDWEKYYKIDFLVEQGFKRKVCKVCGRGFWTLDEERETCPDHDDYTFIGRKHLAEELSYVDVWKKIEKFFVNNGHESIKRYPVVARWYPPLFFTVASIVDFYRLEKGKVVFEFPANPLIVPQFCLRFKDLQNVGVTGRHYTCFVMIGQHSLFNGTHGYWKERTIELDYRLLTEVFKIPPERIVFNEDLWLGSGAFGYSLEYFVDGLELGNAVFTEFLITESGVKEMKNKVVDMGAGLERFSWFLNGSLTSYEVTFKEPLSYLKNVTGVKIPDLIDYFKMAGKLNVDEYDVLKSKKEIASKLGVSVEELGKMLLPLEAVYSIADHVRTLLFAITDGVLPSNVGGGYNLRVVFRRAMSFMDKFGWDVDLVKVAELTAKQLEYFDEELKEHIDEVSEIFEVEKKRYKKARERAKRVIERLSVSSLNVEKLVKLYESEGILPEMIKEFVPGFEVPSNFYEILSSRHEKGKVKKEEFEKFDVEGLPPTTKLFYERVNDYEFDAKVIKVLEGNYVVLDKTLFYPTSGGQDHDTGYINDSRVLDVIKVGDVILHKVDKVSFKPGDVVHGVVDRQRRLQLRKHHTATHILNASARKVLGSWVWQHGAEKKVDRARLDITHYDLPTDEQIERIEEYANEIVKKNLPVNIKILPRVEAEKTYGFRIYQGGAVPSKMIRIVEIPGVDVEACGGLHCENTGEVGFITIISVERIQDGVVRLIFASDEAARKILERRARVLEELRTVVGSDKVYERVVEIFEKWKGLRKEVERKRKEVAELLANNVTLEEINGKKFVLLFIEGLMPEDMRVLSSGLIELADLVVFVSKLNDSYRLHVRAKEDVDAGGLVKEFLNFFGGKGGGSKSVGEAWLKEFEEQKARRLVESWLKA